MHFVPLVHSWMAGMLLARYELLGFLTFLLLTVLSSFTCLGEGKDEYEFVAFF